MERSPIRPEAAWAAAKKSLQIAQVERRRSFKIDGRNGWNWRNRWDRRNRPAAPVTTMMRHRSISRKTHLRYILDISTTRAVETFSGRADWRANGRPVSGSTAKPA